MITKYIAFAYSSLLVVFFFSAIELIWQNTTPSPGITATFVPGILAVPITVQLYTNLPPRTDYCAVEIM